MRFDPRPPNGHANVLTYVLHAVHDRPKELANPVSHLFGLLGDGLDLVQGTWEAGAGAPWGGPHHRPPVGSGREAGLGIRVESPSE